MNNNITNLIKLLENTPNSILPTIEKLYNDNEIDQNFIKIIFFYALDNWTDFNKINDLIVFANNNHFINELLKNATYYEKIIKHTTSLLTLKQISKKNIIFYNKVLTEIKNNLEKFINQIIDNTIDFYHLYFDVDKQKLNTFKNIFFMIIQDIAKNENEKIYNLEYVGHGNFSNVFSLGNKIIKIGKRRMTTNFPNNPYIIKPLLRKEFIIGDYNIIFVEVTEKANINCCTDEDIYNLYKDLRDLHLVWLDPKIKNVGKLTKDNNIHWQNKLLTNDKTLMLEPMRGNICLKAGNNVIIDADTIYDENDSKINLQRVYKYETRYQKSKKN